jgi:adenylate cyclase
LRQHLAIAGFWWAIVLYFALMREWGVDDITGVSRSIPFSLPVALAYATVGGVLIGIPYSLARSFFDTPRFQRRSYPQILLLEGSVEFAIALVAVLAMIVARVTLMAAPGVDLGERITTVLRSPTAVLYFTTVFVATFALNGFHLLQTKIGGRVLWNLLVGKYHQPAQEERVFMFLDMRASTTHAERLGAVRFSSLLQDCFRDLTRTIRLHRVEVYQYVGDEAVLTWTPADGLANANCIRAFFHFLEALEARAAEYEARYGFVPVFKAGINLGPVVAAEVGIVKREIAYHSDVLNTAARIQSQCNELGHLLLVSQAVQERLPPDPRFMLELAGDVVLRGKAQAVKIYGVTRVDNSPELEPPRRPSLAHNGSRDGPHRGRAAESRPTGAMNSERDRRTTPPAIEAHNQRGIAGLNKGRLEALSDGVFAVVLTLLLLDLKVPVPPPAGAASDLAASLLTLWPTLLSCVASFVLLGIVWVAHHLQSHYLRESDRLYAWMNLLFLLTVAFLPFSTALLGSYIQDQVAIVLYGLNLIALALSLYLQWWYATAGHRLVDHGIDPRIVAAIARRMLIFLGLYALAIGLSFFNASWSIALYAGVPMVYIGLQVRDSLRARRRSSG